MEDGMSNFDKSGVYAIRNNINGKLYIGSSLNLRKRRNDHFHLLRINKHFNSHLQSSWDKYGAISFEFIVLECCNEQVLIAKENAWMDNYKTRQKEYGYNSKDATQKLVTDEARKRMSESKKGIALSEEHKHSISQGMKGKNVWSKGRKLSDEHIEKLKPIYESRRGKLRGSIHSTESRLKMSQNRKGKPWTKARREAYSKQQEKINLVANSLS